MSGFPEELVEKNAEAIWETWVASPIVTDGCKGLTWQALQQIAKISDKAAVIRAVALDEARASLSATFAWLREPRHALVDALRGPLADYRDGEMDTGGTVAAVVAAFLDAINPPKE